MRIFAWLLILAPLPAVAEAPCAAPFGQLLGPAAFASYPASTRAFRSVAPDVSHGQAHLFRTEVRRQAGGPADFAGHYRILQIGCGAATLCPAIVDKRSGRVMFPSAINVVSALWGDMREPVEILTYRRDSRLLIVAGSPQENERRAGLYYYEWRGDRLRLVRFTPIATLCPS